VSSGEQLDIAVPDRAGTVVERRRRARAHHRQRRTWQPGAPKIRNRAL